MKELRHLELFSGIGGFRRAIDLVGKDLSIQTKCVGFAEIDKYATQSYKANYNTDGEIELGDISSFVANRKNIENLPEFDLLSGGFPCQAFSMMGKQLGFEDNRGNLFYSIIDILKIKQPKYVLLENVRNLKNHDNGNTFKEIVRSLEKDAGYIVNHDIFNTVDFGLPQTRRRIILFAVRKDIVQSFDFKSELVSKSFSNLNGTASVHKYKSVLDGILDKEVEEKYYLSERIKPTLLANGSKNFRSKSEINQIIARPLTATMAKMHRACQDNYYSEEFLQSKEPLEYLKKSISKEDQAKHRIRKLTPWEALRLQGFERSFFDKSHSSGVSNHQLYKQAGNAVSVNTIYAILHYLLDRKIIKL